MAQRERQIDQGTGVQFDLVFEGVADDSQQSRARLLEELSKQCVAQVFEVDSLLDGGPFLIQRARERAALEPCFEALKDAGAKVLLVQSKFQARAQQAPTSSTTTANSNDESTFRGFFANYAKNITRILDEIDVRQIEELIFDLYKARAEKRQIFIFGNGGSASSASHMAADFAKQRFADDRLLFRIMSLNDNSSCLTATANDFGYDLVFVNQLRNLLQPGDLVIGISSSGNSPNVTRAIRYANEKGAQSYAIVGFNGGELMKTAKKSIYIPTKVGQYGYMEDVTLIINHMISIYVYERDLQATQSKSAK